MKKGIDTNLLVRVLLNDDPIQSPLAYHCLRQAEQGLSKLFVPALVMLEVSWVLEKHYKIARHHVIEGLLDILSFDFLEIEYRDTFLSCLNFAKTNNFDLSDLMIGTINQKNDCHITMTFDKKASKSPYFELLV